MMNRQQINDHTVARDFVDAMRNAIQHKDAANAYILERFMRQPHLSQNQFLRQRICAEFLTAKELERIVAHVEKNAGSRQEPLPKTAPRVLFTTEWRGRPLHVLGETEIDAALAWLCSVASTQPIHMLQAEHEIPHVGITMGEGESYKLTYPSALPRVEKLEIMAAIIQALGDTVLSQLHALEGQDKPMERLAHAVDAGAIPMASAIKAARILGDTARQAGVSVSSFEDFYREYRQAQDEEARRLYAAKQEKKNRIELWRNKVGVYCRARFDILPGENRDVETARLLKDKEIIVRALPLVGDEIVIKLAFAGDLDAITPKGMKPPNKFMLADLQWLADLDMNEVRYEKNVRQPKKRINLD